MWEMIYRLFDGNVYCENRFRVLRKKPQDAIRLSLHCGFDYFSRITFPFILLCCLTTIVQNVLSIIVSKNIELLSLNIVNTD